jgi:hypothetical protein
LNVYKGAPFIVFLHGFMSDLEGKKPNTFLKFAKKNKLSFLALEYSGHGKSSGKFIMVILQNGVMKHQLLLKNLLKK